MQTEKKSATVTHKSTLAGIVPSHKLPSLADLPKAVCPHCGAEYKAVWQWNGKRKQWHVQPAAQLMFGYPGYRGHTFFCQQWLSAEARKLAGRNA